MSELSQLIEERREWKERIDRNQGLYPDGEGILAHYDVRIEELENAPEPDDPIIDESVEEKKLTEESEEKPKKRARKKKAKKEEPKEEVPEEPVETEAESDSSDPEPE